MRIIATAFAALLRHDAAPPGAERIQGDALNAVGVHLMRALSAEKPTLWIIEDLHFAPEEGRAVTLAMARALRPHRVLLVITARPGVPEKDLSALTKLEGFQRLSLGIGHRRQHGAVDGESRFGDFLAPELGQIEEYHPAEKHPQQQEPQKSAIAERGIGEQGPLDRLEDEDSSVFEFSLGGSQF